MLLHIILSDFIQRLVFLFCGFSIYTYFIKQKWYFTHVLLFNRDLLYQCYGLIKMFIVHATSWGEGMGTAEYPE